MKQLISAAILLFSISVFADGAKWISVEADHFNLIYAEGEKATFRITAKSLPTDPDFQLRVDVRYNAVIIDSFSLLNGAIIFETDGLSTGNQLYQFQTHLISAPPSTDLDLFVESQDLQLLVVPTEGSL